MYNRCFRALGHSKYLFLRLQNTCSAVQIDNEAIQLAACSDLSSDLGTDLKFQYTVVDNGNGNSTLRGTIDAAYTSGSIDWASVGFQQDLEMIGGSAIVVKACTSCATGIALQLCLYPA